MSAKNSAPADPALLARVIGPYLEGQPSQEERGAVYRDLVGFVGRSRGKKRPLGGQPAEGAAWGLFFLTTTTMPIIQITLLEGRSAERVSECARQVARAVHQTLGAPLETIRVLVNELPPTHWAVGERTRAEIDATAGEERP